MEARQHSEEGAALPMIATQPSDFMQQKEMKGGEKRERRKNWKRWTRQLIFGIGARRTRGGVCIYAERVMREHKRGLQH